MPFKDVSGVVRPGMFEEPTLPNGNKAKPVSGRGGYTNFDTGSAVVPSRTGDPVMIQMKEQMLNNPPLLLTPHHKRHHHHAPRTTPAPTPTGTVKYPSSRKAKPSQSTKKGVL